MHAESLAQCQFPWDELLPFLLLLCIVLLYSISFSLKHRLWLMISVSSLEPSFRQCLLYSFNWVHLVARCREPFKLPQDQRVDSKSLGWNRGLVRSLGWLLLSSCVISSLCIYSVLYPTSGFCGWCGLRNLYIICSVHCKMKRGVPCLKSRKIVLWNVY